MRDRPISSSLAASLQSLAQCQLQGQMSRSVALDGGAIGVMGVDAALAAVVIGLPYTHRLGLFALVLLNISLVIAMAALLTVGATDMGPAIGEVLSDRSHRSGDDIERNLLEDLASRVAVNQSALDRKERRLTAALALILVAIACELVWQLH